MTLVTVLKSTIAHLGGLEKYTLRLIGEFKKQGCQVLLLTTGKIEQIPQLETIDVRIHHFKSRLSVNKVKEFDRFCVHHLKQHPSQIVFGLDRNRDQTHIRAGNGVHAAYLNRRKKTEGLLKRISFHVNPLHKLLLSIEKESFENPNLQTLFTNSHMVKNEILSYYKVDEKKIQVIHNGVEWNEMQAPFDKSLHLKSLYCQEVGLNEHSYQLLFIGHNFARKGLSELLEALSCLSNYDFQLSVIGTDQNIGFFKDQAHKLSIAHKVKFLGARKDVMKFYQIGDCLVIPSHYDPFANVTLEALASGTPVLAYNCAAATELVNDSKNGWLVHGEDPQNYVLKALEITRLNGTLQNARQYTQECIRQWDWQEITSQVETLFRTTLKSIEKN
jgi:UDP-glucose:(heptosyl)LPS alpha-1,3-glucosyltransferase